MDIYNAALKTIDSSSEGLGTIAKQFAVEAAYTTD